MWLNFLDKQALGKGELYFEFSNNDNIFTCTTSQNGLHIEHVNFKDKKNNLTADPDNCIVDDMIDRYMLDFHRSNESTINRIYHNIESIQFEFNYARIMRNSCI